MADNKITVGIDLEDDATPKINQLKGALSSLSEGGGATKLGEGVNFLDKQLEELKAGIGYTIGAWNVGFMVAEKATELVGDAINQVVENVQTYIHLSNQLQGTNESAAITFGEMGEAATAAGVSISEIAKRSSALMTVGLERPEAIAGAGAIAERARLTGIDVQQAVQSAMLLRTTAQEALGAAQAGGPYAALAEPAREAQRKEVERDFLQFKEQLSRVDQERELEDRLHTIDRAFERETTVNNINRADRQRIEREAMEDTHFRLNDEMEMRNRMTNREMEERHRISQQVRQDTEEQISRTTGIAGGIQGVMAAAVTGDYSKISAFALPAVAAVRAQLPAGYEQLQKDLGIGRLGAMELVRTGAMSPGVILEEARAARELKARQDERAEEEESRQERYREEDQAHDRTIQFHDEEIGMTRRQQKENEQAEWDLYLRRDERGEYAYKQRRDMERGFQDFALKQETDRQADTLDLSRRTLKAYGEDVKARLEEPVAVFAGGELAYVPRSVAEKAGVAGVMGATEKTMATATEYLQRIQEKLDQVLSGG